MAKTEQEVRDYIAEKRAWLSTEYFSRDREIDKINGYKDALDELTRFLDREGN